MRTRSSASSHPPSPSCTPNVAWNSSMFFTTALQRNSGGECGSIASRRAASSARVLVDHAFAQDRKNRWLPVNSSITGGSAPSSES